MADPADHIQPPTDAANGDEPVEQSGRPTAREVWTVPNALCVVRILGAVAMLVLAGLEQQRACLYVLLIMLTTDWLDGKLARWLDQRSSFGAKVDSVADLSMFVSVGLAAIWLRPGLFVAELPWIVAAGGSYLLSLLVGYVRFRRMVSYHPLSAKAAWFATGVAAVVIFADGPGWPLRLAAGLAVLSNLEAVAVSVISRRFRTDVVSVYHVWRRQKKDGRPRSTDDRHTSSDG